MLTKLLQGNSGTTTLVVNGDISVKKHKTYHNSLPKGAGYQLTWSFNFAGVSREDLIRLATETLCISLRPKFKVFGFNKDGKFVATQEQLSEWDNIDWQVADILDKRNSREPRINNVEKAKKLLRAEVKTYSPLEKIMYMLENDLISQEEADRMIEKLEANQ